SRHGAWVPRPTPDSIARAASKSIFVSSLWFCIRLRGKKQITVLLLHGFPVHVVPPRRTMRETIASLEKVTNRFSLSYILRLDVLCTRCNSENSEGDRYCNACGSPLARGCPRCGSSLKAAALFCETCGSPVETPSSAQAEKAPGSALTPRAAKEFDTPLPLA